MSMQDWMAMPDDFFGRAIQENRIMQLLCDTFDAEIIDPERGKMVSDAQVKFFDKLLSEKDFGDKSIDELREQFSTLNQKSGSVWIEKALGLTKLDESKEEVTPAPFG